MFTLVNALSISTSKQVNGELLQIIVHTLFGFWNADLTPVYLSFLQLVLSPRYTLEKRSKNRLKLTILKVAQTCMTFFCGTQKKNFFKYNESQWRSFASH